MDQEGLPEAVHNTASGNSLGTMKITELVELHRITRRVIAMPVVTEIITAAAIYIYMYSCCSYIRYNIFNNIIYYIYI